MAPVCPLPIIKTKSPHHLPIIKTKSKHDQTLRGKENLHSREVLDVPNSSSESSEDESFQRNRKKSTAAVIVDRHWDAPPEKAYSPFDMGVQRTGNVSLTRSEICSMPVHKEDKATSRPLKEANTTPQQKTREKKWACSSKESQVGCDLERANQREPLLELNAAKRKTSNEAPILSNKKHKEARKQQTLHRFLAQRVAPKHGIP
ncbi:hypothetical protein L7F22_000819 [Adiantum nelumboides]|nr:hypothetical protein [Adiantum nelumboides]